MQGPGAACPPTPGQVSYKDRFFNHAVLVRGLPLLRPDTLSALLYSCGRLDLRLPDGACTAAPLCRPPLLGALSSARPQSSALQEAQDSANCSPYLVAASWKNYQACLGSFVQVRSAPRCTKRGANITQRWCSSSDDICPQLLHRRSTCGGGMRRLRCCFRPCPKTCTAVWSLSCRWHRHLPQLLGRQAAVLPASQPPMLPLLPASRHPNRCTQLAHHLPARQPPTPPACHSGHLPILCLARLHRELHPCPLSPASRVAMQTLGRCWAAVQV